MAYKGKFFVRQTVYVCGEYLEADIYPVFQPPGKRRKRCRPTGEIQRRLNQRNAERRLTRLIRTNFGEGDIALHLSYAQEPEDAGKQLRNFLQRLKRKYKKAGLELKYIYTTEYGKKSGRAHHHLILSDGISRDEIETAWGLGYANASRLQMGHDGGAGLGRYLAKFETKREGSWRRWTSSKNLIKPEAVVKDGEISAAELKELAQDIEEMRGQPLLEALHPGFWLTEAGAERNGVNHGCYVRYEMRRKRSGRFLTGGVWYDAQRDGAAE